MSSKSSDTKPRLLQSKLIVAQKIRSALVESNNMQSHTIDTQELNVTGTISVQGNLLLNGESVTGGGNSGGSVSVPVLVPLTAGSNLSLTSQVYATDHVVAGVFDITGSSGSTETKILATFNPEWAPIHTVRIPVYSASSYSIVDMVLVPNKESPFAGQIRCNRWFNTAGLMSAGSSFVNSAGFTWIF